MFHLEFSRDGKPLTFATPIEIIIPAQDVDSQSSLMLLDNKSSSNASAEWSRRSAESNPLVINTHLVGPTDNQTAIQGYKIVFEADTRWIAIANSEEPFTNKMVTTCLSIDHKLNHNNSVVYFISNAGRSTFKVHNTGKNEWSICTIELTPNALSQGSFVVISDLGNENYHFGMTNAVLETDENVVIKSESKTNKEIKEILASL
jgi:hypothetical protein